MKFTKGYYLDENQGEDAKGLAFGYIGRTVDGTDYQGWFFSFPTAEATIWSVSDREKVLDSLELAAEEWDCKPHVISHRAAYEILNRYLRETFDLRRTRASVERRAFVY